MANNYEMGATHVPAECFAPGGAKRMEELFCALCSEIEEAQDNGDQAFDDFISDGLHLEAMANGSLYIASGDEAFCSCGFELLIERAAAEGLLIKSFGMAITFACSKLRPDEFGGVYYRALPSGEVLALSTQLDDLTDQQLEDLIHARCRP